MRSRCQRSAIEYELGEGKIYPQLSEPGPTADDEPTIQPTIEKPIIFSSADTGTSTQDIHAINDIYDALYDGCDSHDCAGVLNS